MIIHKQKLTVSLLLVIFITSANNAVADSSVWKISKGDQQVFIGGTIHVLSMKDYPLPETYDRAYRQSERLVFETNIDQSMGPAFQQTLFNHFAYKQGKTLESAISNATLKTLEQYCASAGIPLSTLLPFKPQFVALMLTSLQLQKLGIDAAGVDQHFNERAHKDNKPVAELETLETQLQFLANMGLGREDELIMSTIKENQQLATLMLAMLSAWRNGDNARLDRDLLAPMRNEFPSIYRDILVTRNNNWLPHIKAYMDTPEVELILVGTLHLVGRDGLIQLLERDGYTVMQW
ncbi:MAG: TraB/GumN family protein [Gammaproteobacteria bacterium]|nr:TraB/GumN family protein [Gammaproteobacteria bacterium]